MKAFVNRDARNIQEAVALARDAREAGRSVSFAAGGTDLLQLVKDRIPNRPGTGTPDVLVNLKTIEGLGTVAERQGAVGVGGLITLRDLAESPLIASRFTAVAEAARSVGTPQIRNTGTLAGNVVQRPWCWYYRNGFPCYKAGGDRCFSVTGENALHAILGGGPSYIVHPSDVAPALAAFDATFQVVGPEGERAVPSDDFFVLPETDARHENVLGDDEVLVSVDLPIPAPTVRSTYRKVMDRAAWTHALASVAVVLDMRGNTCEQARIVLGGVAPVPWRATAAERVLEDRPVTRDVARETAQVALRGARPLAKNDYKIGLTTRLLERAILSLAESA